MLEVKESNKKPPNFISGPGSEIRLPESYNNFNEPVARYRASSNHNDPSLVFQLVKGRTEKTNKDDTFKALPVRLINSYLNIVYSFDTKVKLKYYRTEQIQ